MNFLLLRTGFTLLQRMVLLLKWTSSLSWLKSHPLTQCTSCSWFIILKSDRFPCVWLPSSSILPLLEQARFKSSPIFLLWCLCFHINLLHQNSVVYLTTVSSHSYQVFTLHSEMQTLDQKRVMKTSPPGVRKIVSRLSFFHLMQTWCIKMYSVLQCLEKNLCFCFLNVFNLKRRLNIFTLKGNLVSLYWVAVFLYFQMKIFCHLYTIIIREKHVCVRYLLYNKKINILTEPK